MNAMQRIKRVLTSNPTDEYLAMVEEVRRVVTPGLSPSIRKIREEGTDAERRVRRNG